MAAYNPSAALDLLHGSAARQLLNSQLILRLAYAGPDGYPRAVPIGYLWTGEEFIVCTAEKAPKVRALEADPRVALTIDTEVQPPEILLVRGTASVEIVEGIAPEYLEASKRYVPPEQWADFERQVRGLYPRMARIRIRPEWAKLIDFQNTLPLAIERLVSAQAR
jgi:hypothetical protein